MAKSQSGALNGFDWERGYMVESAQMEIKPSGSVAMVALLVALTLAIGERSTASACGP